MGAWCAEEPNRERTGFLIMPKRPYEWRGDSHGCYKFNNADLALGPDTTAHFEVNFFFTGPATEWIGPVPAFWEQPAAARYGHPGSIPDITRREQPHFHSQGAQLTPPISRDDDTQRQDAPRDQDVPMPDAPAVHDIATPRRQIGRRCRKWCISTQPASDKRKCAACCMCGQQFSHGEARLQQWCNRNTYGSYVHAHCVNGGLGHDHELRPKQAGDQEAVDAVARQRETIIRTAADTEVLLPYAQDPDQPSTALQRFKFALQQAQHAILRAIMHHNPSSLTSEPAWKALVQPAPLGKACCQCVGEHTA